MNHIFKVVVLSCVLALCAVLFGCSGVEPTDDLATEAQGVSASSGNVCDQFCQSQGGPFYLFTFATSETQCTQKGGQWFTEDQGYMGPPPGCCCKCARPDFCL